MPIDHDSSSVDLLIIGGGINGCGIARDAAGRGLSVTLCEMSDLAQATSSASTKLFHGGLRYLEHYEFRLVRESLTEREVLLRAMPHISWPMRFVLPHHRGLRPAWLLRLGLFLYDHIGGRKLLPASKHLNLRTDPAGGPLKPLYTKGFEYSDCWVDDARLVILNARDAAAKGAAILPRTKLVSAERTGPVWTAVLRDMTNGDERTVTARCLVNAAGPWATDLIRQQLRGNATAQVRLVRGSHIVTRQLFAHDRCYIFQNRDGRIVFAIPYEDDFTLIGTTDQDHDGDPANAVCTAAETAYLCAAVSEYFSKPVTPDDVVWTYSGVRPLYDDGATAASHATRDYTLELDERQDGPPLLNIFGGKITTYRRLAEAALAKLSPHFPAMGRPWTAGVPLPGGDFPVNARTKEIAQLRNTYPFLTERWAARLWRSYGTETRTILGNATAPADLGQTFGADLTEREVIWLMDHEWAQTAEDIVWRRSKLGLRMKPAEITAMNAWMQQRLGP